MIGLKRSSPRRFYAAECGGSIVRQLPDSASHSIQPNLHHKPRQRFINRRNPEARSI